MTDKCFHRSKARDNVL